MNFQIIRNIIGYIMLIEAAFMIPALFISLSQQESASVMAFGATIVLLIVVGLPMAVKRAARKSYYAREGFVTVGLGWIVVSIFGALPFTFSGSIPSFVDALFETISGFTTTGASILTDVEALPMGMLYWRSFTHWLGGMGVLVFLLAIGPISGGDSGDTLYLLRAESPGVNVSKLVPRMRRSALILYQIYIALTVIQTILLLLGDVPLFDSVTLSMATAGTGGFSIKNTSVASYSTYAQIIITIFMFLFGVNFNVFYLLLLRQFRRAVKSEEFFVYLGTFVISVGIIVFSVLPLFENLFQALLHTAFTVASIMSTTGFITVDYDLWPQLPRMLLLLLMF
ncbi:MAG: potassium transporter TrkG, partial [Eubacteriales bacterium]|nr:potassium transporter TrkG [Eubacteriales bacterium]